MTPPPPASSLGQPIPARYLRQVLFASIGEEGQRRLLESRVLLVGCGALGSVLADTLVRAGVGSLRICDRDFIELDNLQRQVLFDERDIQEGIPKAEAAARRLRSINSTVEVEPVIVDVNHTNLERLAAHADLILDGTDNFETRYLVNDYAIRSGVPWVYGAVLGSTGSMMPIIPHQTPCLRCVFDHAPPPELSPTCDTAGVIAPAVHVVAGLQATEALKILTGALHEVSRVLIHFDLWSGHFGRIKMGPDCIDEQCPCCHAGDFEYLSGRRAAGAVTLCGRNAVQIVSAAGRLDFQALARRLEPVSSGPVRVGPFMLTAAVDGLELSLFPDGRAIIKGTDSIERAKTVYAKYVGA